MSFIATVLYLVQEAIPTLPTYLQDQTWAAIRDVDWGLDCPGEEVIFRSRGKTLWEMPLSEFDPRGLAYRAR